MENPSVSFFAGLVQGGAEKQAVETAKLLHQNGHAVIFYCYNLKKAFYHPENEIQVVDLKKYDFPLPEIFDKVFSIFRLAWIIRKKQPDFLISFTTLLNVLTGLIGLINVGNRKTSFIGSERNSVLRYTSSSLWKYICRIFYHGLDGLFANNSPAVSQLRTIIHYRPERTFLLPNILDTEYFSREEQAIPYSVEQFSILIPARICDQKNQKILVPVAALLKQKGKRVLFVLAGNPEAGYANDFRAKIREEELESYFDWLGQYQDMRSLYSSCDMTFLPSKFEGFSNSIIEAMACESIVMGSEIPSFTDVIHDAQNGFIADAGNPEAITDKIVMIMELTAEQQQELRKNSRVSVLGYGRAGYYKNILEIFRQVKQP